MGRLIRIAGPGIGPRPRGPDEDVAAELEFSANRAQTRGGLAAAAAFLERAVLLTADPAHHVERTLAAAQANLQAGAFGKALDLLVRAQAGPLDELQSARVDLLRGQIVFASGLGSDAPPLLLKAAKRLESLNLDLARETYLSAWMAALFAGRLAGASDLLEVSRASRALPPLAHPPRPVDLVLDGLTLLVTDGPAAAAPTLRQAASTFAGTDIAIEDGLRWGWMAQAAASAVWDDDTWGALLERQLRLARDAGALGTNAAWRGDFAAAAALIAEADAVCGGDRESRRPVRRDDARVSSRQRSRGRPADRGHHHRGRGRGTGNRGDLRALGCCNPPQRPRPL